MPIDSIFSSLMGGSLIGLAITGLLLFNGRVTGLSGIMASALSQPKKDGLWRWLLLLGLITGGALTYKVSPELFTNTSDRGFTSIILAGFFVGYGTVMGSGCTSGHAICGISRFSIRSIVATVTFMIFGFASVQVFIHFFGGTP